jgi:ribosome-associated toxin RatA of RatAB toxin-antitoxin module
MVGLNAREGSLAYCPNRWRQRLSRCAVLLGLALAVSAAGAEPRVIVKETAVPRHALPRMEATLEIEAPVERIWPLVSDCNRFREYMDLESARVVAQRGTWSRCQMVVDLPFPFGKLRSVVDNFDERRPGVYRTSWKLVSGDYDYDEGFWELTPTATGRTRVRLVTLTEPQLPVPRGMLRDGQRDYVKDVLLRLRKRALAVR